jgi:hypothetical protein
MPAQHLEVTVNSWEEFLQHHHFASALSPHGHGSFSKDKRTRHIHCPSLLRAIGANPGAPDTRTVLAYEESCCEEFAT